MLPKSSHTKRNKESMWGYIFIAPQVIGMCLFIIAPVIASFFISFTEWDFVSSPKWVGIRNYETQLTSPLFWKILGNTVYYTVATVAGGIILAVLLALLVNVKLKGVEIYRALYFIPVITPMVAVALVWVWLYNPDFGVINYLLSLIGINGPDWLASVTWAMPAIIIMSLWKGLGYNMTIFLAGLQDIPSSLYEAAEIDGANSWSKFRYITLPMLSPILFFVLIMSLIGGFQMFTESYVMTRGGPADATNVIVLQIYNLAFRWWKMGEAAAISWILFVIILTITFVQFSLSKKWVFYERG